VNSPVPRTPAIHDLSGFDRASLTVIIPILSTLGIQVCSCRPYRKRVEPGKQKGWLLRLANPGPPVTVVISVLLRQAGGTSAVVAFNRKDGRFWMVDCTSIPAYQPRGPGWRES
jgi:hypothetical protein